MKPKSIRCIALVAILSVSGVSGVLSGAEPTRLLRQPSLGAEHIVFAYGGDLWIADRDVSDGEMRLARRLTSTPAVETAPHLSPDGQWVAFGSNRSGTPQVWVVASEGGTPRRLTWYPARSIPRGWTPDGQSVLYASTRATAPVGHDRLWTVSLEGGPSTRVPSPRGHTGSYSSDGRHVVIDRVRRWDREWRRYRGGQNRPLVVLDLESLEEVEIPCERTTDTQPVWLGERIYFLSDREKAVNVWSFDVSKRSLSRLTDFEDVDIKWLSGHGTTLAFERAGSIHTLDLDSGTARRVDIVVRGDFPWAETRWEDISKRVRAASLSPTGKRALFEARGEVFTVPVKKGDTRNLTRSSGAADRSPVWSPKGDEIAWFSDSGSGYELLIGTQDGLSKPRRISIGESKMAWEATWSPDAARIAFADDDVRVRVVEVATGEITTADVGGANIERGRMGLVWSPDSRWLAYAKFQPNNFRRIVVWSVEDGQARPITDAMADAISPAWDRSGKHLYFLASTDLALGSGWANTSTMEADPTYGAYLIVLDADGETPFIPESDEEGKDRTAEKKRTQSFALENDEAAAPGGAPSESEKNGKNPGEETKEEPSRVDIDFEGVERRVVSLPVPVRRYRVTMAGPEGSVLIGEQKRDGPGMTLHKFTIKERKASVFLEGASPVSISADGKKLLTRSGPSWKVVGTGGPKAAGGDALTVSLRVRLDRLAEWRQIFDEAWRYERDFFYDPGLHGRNWDLVRERYEPLVPHVRHRADLNYVLDQVSGELSVGHSFVFGGDMPEVDTPAGGVLGADLEAHEGRWRIERIYTYESWNPGVKAPLDRPGLGVEAGHYVLAINGEELTAADDPYRLLEGTAGRQTLLHVNDVPSMEDARAVTVEPISSESALRQRAWVEDNRRVVDRLSAGKLAYVWVPNTTVGGVVSFNRYYFAQQDRQGAVIDERFNGGGLLDDYMVDLMTRRLRAAITNEVPGGRPFRLPAGILGPKVLLINEVAGSGGDFFPWVFRQQKAGPLIGTRTWGGLVKSSVHYPFVDGGAMTSPDNAVFDPIGKRWIGENEGIPPDIEVTIDAKSAAAGRDPQLERGVAEALRLLETEAPPPVEPPPFPTPALITGADGKATALETGWRKHVINDRSPFEAAGAADFNGDGRLDVFSGDSWYENPTWKRHKVRDVKVSPNPHYMEDFADLPLDVNGDGKMDIVTCNYFGKRIGWVEHPGDPTKPWIEHTVDTPSPSECGQLIDVNGDGKLDFLPNTVRVVTWYELVAQKPKVEWRKHDLGKKAAGHGIGVGDINRDGRTDIITPKGWLEQPESGRDEDWVFHPEFQLGGASILIIGKDFDADGDTDILWGMGHTFGLYFLRQSLGEDGKRVWTKETVDESFSQVHTLHLADLDGNGEPEVVTGKRVYAHEVEPGATDAPSVSSFHYDRKTSKWVKRMIYEGKPAKNAPKAAKDRWALEDFERGSVGTGLQIDAKDIDGDGDLDLVCPGKTGLYWLENPRNPGT